MVLVMRCTLQTNIKILDTPNGEKHPEPCALICSGISRHDDTTHSWSYLGWRNWKLGKRVDVSECGFVSDPVITATTRVSQTGNGKNCPSVTTEQLWMPNLFYAISTGEYTVEDASKQCDIHWIATGYICS